MMFPVIFLHFALAMMTEDAILWLLVDQVQFTNYPQSAECAMFTENQVIDEADINGGVHLK